MQIDQPGFNEPRFDLWHEDALLLDDHPEWFVLLDREPVVWTVRGVRLLRPRFALLGVSLSSIRSADEFNRVWSRWQDMELQLLERKIRQAGSGPDAPLASQCLKAVWDGDTDLFELLIARLEAQQRAEGNSHPPA